MGIKTGPHGLKAVNEMHRRMDTPMLWFAPRMNPHGRLPQQGAARAFKRQDTKTGMSLEVRCAINDDLTANDASPEYLFVSFYRRPLRSGAHGRKATVTGM